MTTSENSTIEPTEAPPASDTIVPEPVTASETAQGQDAGLRPEAESAPAVEEPGAQAGMAPVESNGSAAQPIVEEPVVERPAPVADEVLLASVDIAREALLEVTPAETIGAPVGHAAEDDHVLSLFFDSKLRGYPGWHWTVTLARVGDDGAPTVLETELMPGENALLAPDWVPWSERLADYQAGQEVAENEARALAEAAALLDDDDDEDDVFSILHAGDVDGVDVDEIDEDESDVDEIDEDESDDDEDSDDDESDDDDEDSDDDSDDDDESDDESDDDESDDDDSDDGESDDEYDGDSDVDRDSENEGPDRSY